MRAAGERRGDAGEAEPEMKQFPQNRLKETGAREGRGKECQQTPVEREGEG